MELFQLRDLYVEVQFALRRSVFSKMKLRTGLPRIPTLEQLKNQNDFYQHILDLEFTREQALFLEHIVDIGCGNWSYLQTLADTFPHANLTGIEVDGGRRYWNLYRRIDMARAFAKHLTCEGKTIEVMEGDFRQIDFRISSKNVLFCFFFPFVSDNPCHGWGLPHRFADFTSLLLHSQNLAKISQSQAQWLSIHQGDWEGEIAQKIYDSLNIPVELTQLSAKDCPASWCRPYDTWIFITRVT